MGDMVRDGSMEVVANNCKHKGVVGSTHHQESLIGTGQFVVVLTLSASFMGKRHSRLGESGQAACGWMVIMP